ncbi:MAG: magnesium transporter [Microscillaceae bacterium]
MSFEISLDFYESLKEAIAQRTVEKVKAMLEPIRAEDLSAILYELDTEDCVFVFHLLDDETIAEIVANLDEDTRQEFLRNFSPTQTARWINHMDSDDAADLLNEMPLKTREEILAFTDLEVARDINDLLRYEEDSAGGLMAKELIRANVNWTVVQAIEEIRRQAEEVEKIYSLYVVDDHNLLLGRVSLKKIILASDQTRIADIYEDDLLAVKTYDDQEDVVEIMQKYDLEAVPVVNARGELMGRITIDDVVDVITEKADLDRQLMAGISEDVEEDDSIFALTRARLPWLIVGMAGGLLGARFIGFFEADLALLPAMAFFIPLITATGGNVGIQSSSIILQSLANKSSFMRGNFLLRMGKVIAVAIINGLVIGLIVFGFSFVLEVSVQLAFTVSIALFFVVLLASIMGTITPLILDKMHINPAVASGPFITTANDLLGLAVYFTMAHLLFKF